MGPHAWPKAVGIGFFIFMIAPVSLATAQEVQDLCNQVASVPVASVAVDVPAVARSEVAKIEVDKPDVAKSEVNKPDVAKSEVAQIAVATIEIAKIDRCVHPSPIGVRYDPEITAKIHRKYEDSLVYAKGVTNEAVVSHVIFNATIDVTTPPGFFYRQGDFVGGPYDTFELCMQAGQQAGNGGVCEREGGPIFISLSGHLTNGNPFPLRSVNIRCDYLGALGLPQSLEVQFPDILGPEGSIPYQDKIISELKPHSVVKEISCQPKTAEIWRRTDEIQSLNAPFQP